MTPTDTEEQEAESLRYGPKVVRLLPLTSGNLAVLGLGWEPIGYASGLAEAIEIAHKWADGFEAKMERERVRKIAAARQAPIASGFNPEDLGL